MSSSLFGCYPRSCDISIDALEFTHVFSPEKLTESNSYYRPQSPDTHEGHDDFSDKSDISGILPHTPITKRNHFRRLGPLTSTLVNTEAHKIPQANSKHFVDVCCNSISMDFVIDSNSRNEEHCVAIDGKLSRKHSKIDHVGCKGKLANKVHKVNSSAISPWKGKLSFRRTIARKLKLFRKQGKIKCDATFEC